MNTWPFLSALAVAVSTAVFAVEPNKQAGASTSLEGKWIVLSETDSLPKGTLVVFANDGEALVVASGNSDIQSRGRFACKENTVRFTGDIGKAFANDPYQVALPCSRVLILKPVNGRSSQNLLVRATGPTKQMLKVECAAQEAYAAFTRSTADMCAAEVAHAAIANGPPSPAVCRKALDNYDAAVGCAKSARDSLEQYRSIIEMLGRNAKEQQAELAVLVDQLGDGGRIDGIAKAVPQCDRLHEIGVVLLDVEFIREAHEKHYRAAVVSLKRAVQRLAGLKSDVRDLYAAAGELDPFLK